MPAVAERGRSLEDAWDVADPGADFVDLTITRLGLSGQRREIADATRWLDAVDRELLSLWWLEAAGELTRDHTGADDAPVPQYLTREMPDDPATVPQTTDVR